jgi:hypothetical protein
MGLGFAIVIGAVLLAVGLRVFYMEAKKRGMFDKQTRGDPGPAPSASREAPEAPVAAASTDTSGSIPPPGWS